MRYSLCAVFTRGPWQYRRQTGTHCFK